MPTRTTQVYGAVPAAGVSTTAFTCPANTTFVWKSAGIFNTGLVADTVVLAVVTAAGGVYYLKYVATLASLTAFEWNGWLVLLPADRIVVSSSGGITSFLLSGAKLPGVA